MNVPPLPHLTFVLGGARSGKSRYAEGLVMDCAPPWIYIATAEAHDGEMSAKITAHRNRRDGRWRTIEAPLDLPGAIAAHGNEEQAVLVDCPDARVGRPRHPDVREHLAVAAYDGSELVRLASFQDGFHVWDNVDGGRDTILRRSGFAWKDTRRRDRYRDRARR